jgi:hypothetical protein
VFVPLADSEKLRGIFDEDAERYDAVRRGTQMSSSTTSWQWVALHRAICFLRSVAAPDN